MDLEEKKWRLHFLEGASVMPCCLLGSSNPACPVIGTRRFSKASVYEGSEHYGTLVLSSEAG